MNNNIPNFDSMNHTELANWASLYQKPTPKLAANVLIGRPRGFVSIVKTISLMAKEVAAAKRIRHKKGNLSLAFKHEMEAERIMFEELPDFARPIWTFRVPLLQN